MPFVQHYRAVESAAEKAGAAHIKALTAALAKRTSPARKTHRRENCPAAARPKLTALIHIMAPSWHLRPSFSLDRGSQETRRWRGQSTANSSLKCKN